MCASDLASLDPRKSLHFLQAMRLIVLCCAVVTSVLRYLRSEQKAGENHLGPPKYLLEN